MNNVTLLALDLAKENIQLHGIDQAGKGVYKRRVSSDNLLETLANFPKCKIAMEACATSNHWGRELTKLGFSVKLIAAQRVKPFIGHQKNDKNDARGIALAAQQPDMLTVGIKTLEQQDIQSIHRVKTGYTKSRVALSNRMRGLLMEYGFKIKLGFAPLREALPDIISEPNDNLSQQMRIMLQDLYEEFISLDKKVAKYDKMIDDICNNNEVCKRLVKLEGVGTKTATMAYAKIGDPAHYKNGRNFSASVGLVPRQHSSGEKNCNLGITKMGDRYLRWLFIQGAQAGLRSLQKKDTPKAQYYKALMKRVGKHKAVVAMANKNARLVFALLKNGEDYDPNYHANTNIEQANMSEQTVH